MIISQKNNLLIGRLYSSAACCCFAKSYCASASCCAYAIVLFHFLIIKLTLQENRVYIRNAEKQSIEVMESIQWYSIASIATTTIFVLCLSMKPWMENSDTSCSTQLAPFTFIAFWNGQKKKGKNNTRTMCYYCRNIQFHEYCCIAK